METSLSAGDTTLNLSGVPNSRHAAIAADAPSTMAQVDVDDEYAILSLSRNFGALDGLGVRNYDMTVPLDGTPEASDSNNRSKPPSEAAGWTNSDAEGQTAERGGNNLGRHTATPPLPDASSTRWVSSNASDHTNNLSHSSFIRGYDESAYDFNNKREMEINQSLPESHWQIMDSTFRDATSSNHLARGFEATRFEEPEEAPLANSVREAEPPTIRDIVAAYPKLPPGYNFIQLDKTSDETSVAAYMALQSHKTIFMIRKRLGGGSQLSHYAKIFEAITQCKAFYCEPRDGSTSIRGVLQAFRDAAFPAILLLAHDGLQGVQLQSALPDCVVHWGVPLDVASYVSQISSLRYPVRSCLIFPREEDSSKLRIRQWHMSNCGIFQYPEAVLHACFGPGSAFPIVWQVSAQVVTASNATQKSMTRERVGESSGGAVFLPPLAPVPAHQYDTHTSLGSGAMPSGHYYIVVEEGRDTEVIALMLWIAMQSKKTICYLPSDRNIDTYRGIVKSAAGIKAVSSSAISGRAFKRAVEQFRNKPSRVLLRPAATVGKSTFSNFITSCLVYWGVPSSMRDYMNECSTKAAHSCMVITRSEHQTLGQQITRFSLNPHPTFRQINGCLSDPRLHRLSQKVGACLSNAQGSSGHRPN